MLYSVKAMGKMAIFIGKKFFVSTLAHTQTSNLQVISTKIIELLEENTREKLHDAGLANNFLDMTPIAQMTKAKTNKLAYIHQFFFFPQMGRWQVK